MSDVYNYRLNTNIKVVNESHNQLPEYKHDGDSGLDCRVWVTQEEINSHNADLVADYNTKINDVWAKETGSTGMRRMLYNYARPIFKFVYGYNFGADVVDYVYSTDNEYDTITILPHTSYVFNTGISVDIPYGMEIMLRPRSGMSIKGIFTWGTIDYDYTDQIRVICWNHSNKPFFVRNGDRIGQLVLQNVRDKVSWDIVDNIDEFVNADRFNTNTRSGGLGHTGVK